MHLPAGTRLGPYEIVAAAGAGGMGEVYRARDTRLDRTVAIKVLPAHLSEQPERRQRFDREARAISSLNHPNICTLYDVGHQEGVDYLVMEYMEGESLADRLDRGPLPPEQLLKYGVEICEGLEKAHRSGVVHRDLKPGNIMLTKTGAKLMDFGLAKTANPEAPSALTVSLTGPGAKPLTAEGMVVGTFQYMAPEQLEGKEADARSDIFALGSVLYEMATGQRAFTGKSQASVVAAILASEPQPISSLRPMSPPALDRVVKLCLAKDPDERWQTAHDVKLQLRWIAEGGSQAGVPAPVAARRRHSQSLAWVVAAVCLLAAIALGAAWMARAPKAALPLQASILPPKDSSFTPFSFAISPDGRKLAFVARNPAGTGDVLWVRPLDSTVAQPLAGTEEAAFPFWSPDSRSIGFFAGRWLKRIDAGGGPAITLAEALVGRGGSWGPDGTILFAPSSVGGLWRVSASGGQAVQVTTPKNPGAERSHRWPFFLPDGSHLLFYNSAPDAPGVARPGAGSGIYLLDLKTGAESLVQRAIGQGQYADGHLFYLEQGNLMTQPFDLSSLSVSGTAVVVAEQVQYDSNRWVGGFSVSAAGPLIYAGGGSTNSELVLYGRDGKELGKVAGPEEFDIVSLSPDATRVATSVGEGGGRQRDIWIYELSRGTGTRLTFEGVQAENPIWSRDGSKIAYSDTPGRGSILVKPSSGLGEPKVIAQGGDFAPNDWSPDGNQVLYMSFLSSAGPRVWIHQFGPEAKDYDLLHTSFPTAEAQLSSDGHWLAFTSDETGRQQVYVMPYPSLSGKWQISIEGGSQARWRRDGKEIYYIAPDAKLMRVTVDTAGGAFHAGIPSPLFQTQIAAVAFAFHQYDVTGDGKRFLINTRRTQGTATLTIYSNWEAALKR